jgi:23S rRNA (adenine1618-N6)-methyltransferase
MKAPIKEKLHPRNKNREPYDLKALVASIPDLSPFISINRYGNESVDFSNPTAVKLLNTALLKHYYGIENWILPENNLCPPIPGRADYIHYVADLLTESNEGKLPPSPTINCFDLGMGASCIYPIIGTTEYNWKFLGSDIDPKSVASAQRIIDSNPSLSGHIETRLQENPASFFKGVLKEDEYFDLTVCNPPFHATKKEAEQATRRKVHNLSGKKLKSPTRNFGGVYNELIYEDGEFGFIENMIEESTQFSKHCFWFTTLVSKGANLEGFYHLLDRHEVFERKTIPMGTGNKTTRILAWTFLSNEEQKDWRATS